MRDVRFASLSGHAGEGHNVREVLGCDAGKPYHMVSLHMLRPTMGRAADV
jgi:hypothetical protein